MTMRVHPTHEAMDPELNPIHSHAHGARARVQSLAQRAGDGAYSPSPGNNDTPNPYGQAQLGLQELPFACNVSKGQHHSLQKTA